MKKLYIIPIVILVISSLASCIDDDAKMGSKGKPEIEYVRSCDPAEAEIHLTEGLLGNKVAIIGRNFSAVNKVYFNDQLAKLNPVFVTDRTIIVDIPSDIPGEKLDLITLCTPRDTSYYTFMVNVPAPSIRRMNCEYVEEGDIAVILGNYFVDDATNPLKVTFTGDVDGEIISSTVNSISVKVPSDAQSGTIRVTSVYGTAESRFHFRDKRGIIVDFDNPVYSGSPSTNIFNGWHGDPSNGQEASKYGTENGVDGRFLNFEGPVTVQEDGWVVTADALFCYDRWPAYNDSRSVDLFSGALNTLSLKFEVKAKDWTGGGINFFFIGPQQASNCWWEPVSPETGLPNNWGDESWKQSDSYPRIIWAPWAETENKSFSTDDWITVTIPMTENKYGFYGAIVEPKPLGLGFYSGLTVSMWRSPIVGTSCNPRIQIDNVRVVPN